ncbi:MAG: hypothetical protein U5L03_10835 [Burkholderiaceae bacterium]|nr:hypothetical protein [Burkholderiaceae bacterium]
MRLVTDDYAAVIRRTRQATAPTVMVFVTRMRQRLEQPRKKLTGSDLTAIAEPISFGQIKPLPRPEEVWDEVLEPAEHRLPRCRCTGWRVSVAWATLAGGATAAPPIRAGGGTIRARSTAVGRH